MMRKRLILSLLSIASISSAMEPIEIYTSGEAPFPAHQPTESELFTKAQQQGRVIAIRRTEPSTSKKKAKRVAPKKRIQSVIQAVEALPPYDYEHYYNVLRPQFRIQREQAVIKLKKQRAKIVRSLRILDKDFEDLKELPSELKKYKEKRFAVLNNRLKKLSDQYNQCSSQLEEAAGNLLAMYQFDNYVKDLANAPKDSLARRRANEFLKEKDPQILSSYLDELEFEQSRRAQALLTTQKRINRRLF